MAVILGRCEVPGHNVYNVAMCGIVGYVGKRQAWPIIVQGLETLEYRGYDSSGIVVLDPPNNTEFHRAVGKVTELKASINGRIPTGTVGLGHTRWATHGKPTLLNAHPHTGPLGEVAVVHNGIVENFLELKRTLVAEGHVFTSETDTEVIAHIIEGVLSENKTFEEAFASVVSRIQGANAVVALCIDQPDRIMAFRRGHAGGLAISHQDSESIVASDVHAILPHSSTVTFLEDGEIATISENRVDIFNSHLIPVVRKFHSIPLEWTVVGKDGYRHFMLKEIMEQSQVVSQILSGRIDFENRSFQLEELPFSLDEINDIDNIRLIGSGTSYNAALLGRYFMETLSGIPSEAETSSEFRYRQPIINEKTLVISIGQSGETADTLGAMAVAQAKGARTITICNVDGSQATRMAEAKLLMRCGLEIGVASTKTFMASIIILTILGAYLGQKRGFIDKKTLSTLVADISYLPRLIGEMLGNHEPYKKLSRELFRYEHLIYLGRGSMYPIAMEGALKIKEISYIHAEAHSAGEMKHGPIALIDDRMATIALAPQTALYEKMMNNIKEIKARDGIVVAVSTEGDDELPQEVDHILQIPKVSELVNAIISTIPMQLLAYYIAIQRGCDVDQPRNLAKSVTVE